MTLKIAFYAPMKPPNHETPSGDRTIARLLIAALEEAGHSVTLISGFRALAGMPEQQDRLRAQAAQERLQAAEAVSRRKPDVWLTYHLSYKAPDWLGPQLSRKFGIPYVVVEASLSPRRANGPWKSGVADVRAALKAARAIMVMKERDRPALERLPGLISRLVTLPSFTDAAAWPIGDRTRRKGAVDLLAAAMMRPGDKLESYRHMAAALRTVRGSWRLTVAGDGPVRREVEAFFQPFKSQIRFAASVEQRMLQSLYHDADCLVWPGIGEGIGMVYLEAQATGLPVAACDTAGVPGVVQHGHTGLLAAPDNPAALGEMISRLIADPAARARLGAAAAAHIRAHHDIAQACRCLDRMLTNMTGAAP